jgi:hypothetical protein
VSVRGRPNEVAYTLSQKSFSVLDYALMDFVSADEEANADAPLEPRLISGKIVDNYLQLMREIRVAAVVFGAANYGANTAALAGTDRWDNAASDPITKLLTAIEAALVRPNVLVVGAQAWTSFQTNAAVLKYLTGRPMAGGVGTPIITDPDFIARALGLDKIVIGRAKYVTSNEGATVTSDYVWGKSAALIRVEPAPNARETSAFGYTFRFGQKIAQAIPDLITGVRGGVYMKVSHSDDERPIGGGNTGYLYTTVIS